MKVSDRIQQLQMIVKYADITAIDSTIIQRQLIELEMEIVKALQAAKQEGWDAGHRWMCIKRLAAGKGD